MSAPPPKPRHRESRHRESRQTWRPWWLPAVAVVVLLTGMGVLFGTVRGGDGTADLGRAANADGGTTARGADRPADTASGPATRSSKVSRSNPRPAPYHVVSGAVIRHKTAAQLRAERALVIASRSFSVTIGTFNVLGSNHTARGGDHPRYPSAGVRSVGAANLIRRHGVDVLGAQEVKPDQLNALKRMTGMAAWPDFGLGSRNTDDNILYDPSKFEFVSGTTFSLRFMNSVRPQTVLLLRDRATGREAYFVNMHASAVTAPRYAASRNAGHLLAAAEINKLRAASPGIPIFLTGDMNDRAGFFCRFVPRTGMVAAVGGNDAGGCHPAPHLAVDWILGTPDVTFSNYWEDRSPIGRVSDHFFVSAVAHVPGR
ncbi:MAG TPA: endonuclease/exonuclease/phosphatase family protein [Nocardioides sp.]|nr:endonuclease/exonuclease/phosphatase family protein [Nocardioides sp.]